VLLIANTTEASWCRFGFENDVKTCTERGPLILTWLLQTVESVDPVIGGEFVGGESRFCGEGVV